MREWAPGRPDYWPVPESATVAVAVGLLAVTVRVAACAPVAVGANWARMTQLEPGAKVAPQLFTATKDAAPVPVSAIEVRFRGVVLLVLVKVADCAALAVPCVMEPKLSVVVESENVGAVPPVPLSVADCVVDDALSVKTRVADWLPVAVGEKRTRAVQLADTARELGQLLSCEKEAWLVPPSVIEEMASAALPVLVMAMAWAGL